MRQRKTKLAKQTNSNKQMRWKTMFMVDVGVVFLIKLQQPKNKSALINNEKVVISHQVSLIKLLMMKKELYGK